MKIKTEYPFDDYTVYKYFHKMQGRWYVSLHNPFGSNMIMLYSRYLMCIKVGRILETQEEVHHKDEDKTNDDIDNLQILSDEDHRKLNQVKLINLKCIKCGKVFKRIISEHKRSMKRNYGIFCGTSCSSKHTQTARLSLV